MSIKLALLKSGENIIADIKELISDDKTCGYLFNNPHVLGTRTPILLSEDNDLAGDVEISLSPWIILSSDEKVPVRSDWIVTIVEPVDTVKKIYEEKVNGQIVKLIVLTSKEILLSEIEEVGGEIGEPDCKLIDPVILQTTDDKLTIQEGKVTLTKWLCEFTYDKNFMISSDKIITLAEPAPQILEKYEALVNKTK